MRSFKEILTRKIQATFLFMRVCKYLNQRVRRIEWNENLSRVFKKRKKKSKKHTHMKKLNSIIED